MESRIGPFWPMIVLTLALPAGAQSATDSQGEMTAAGETPDAVASAPADDVGATQTTHTPAAPQESAAVPQKNAVTAAESLYWLNVQGKRFVALTIAKDGSGRITLPCETQAYPVAYDAALSAQLSP